MNGSLEIQRVFVTSGDRKCFQRKDSILNTCMDKPSEFLSFPTVHRGKTRVYNERKLLTDFCSIYQCIFYVAGRWPV